MKLRVLTICMAVLCCKPAGASKTDSLLQELYKASHCRSKLTLMLAACFQNDIHLDTFSKYAFVAKKLAANCGTPTQQAQASYGIAYAWYYAGENDSARMEIDQAIKRIDTKDAPSKTLYYKLKSLKATTYQGERNNAAALKVLFPLLQEAETNKDSLFMAQFMHQIAIIEGQQNNPRQLIAWETKALAVLPFSNPDRKNILGTIYATIGKAYAQENNSDSASKYHEQAIEIFRSNEDFYNLSIVLQREANVLIAIKDQKNAKEILAELEALNQKFGTGEGDVNYHLTFINYYLVAGEYEKAIALCKDHLYGDLAIANWKIRLSYLQALAKGYHAMNKTDAYAKTLEELVAAKDSFYNANSAEAIAEVQTRYEVQKKENTIISQRLSIFRKNIFLYGSLLALVAGATIAWLVFRNYRRKNEIKMLLLQEEEKRKAALAVKEAEEKERKRIAADLHDSLGSYAASIKANADDILRVQQAPNHQVALLQNNAQQMVALLGDTIWALRKDGLMLSDISDRVKVLLKRLRPNYPGIEMWVDEDLQDDFELSPVAAFELFMIIQEGISNALKHAGANHIVVRIQSEDKWTIGILDNGIGIGNKLPSLEGGNGMYTMQTRAANLGFHIAWKELKTNGTEVLITTNTV